jgi:hypothetical protein
MPAVRHAAAAAVFAVIVFGLIIYRDLRSFHLRVLFRSIIYADTD